MEIKAQSIYNEETMKALAKIVIKQKLLPIYLVLTVLLTIELAIIANVATAVIFMVFFAAVTAFTMKVSMSAQYKNLYKLQGTHNYFLFRDNDFTCASKSPTGEYQGNCLYSYTLIYRVVETKNHLVIYINKVQAHIIDKNTIEDGTIDNIRCRLMPLLGKKYKITK